MAREDHILLALTQDISDTWYLQQSIKEVAELLEGACFQADFVESIPGGDSKDFEFRDIDVSLGKAARDIMNETMPILGIDLDIHNTRLLVEDT